MIIFVHVGLYDDETFIANALHVQWWLQRGLWNPFSICTKTKQMSHVSHMMSHEIKADGLLKLMLFFVAVWRNVECVFRLQLQQNKKSQLFVTMSSSSDFLCNDCNDD